MPAAPDIKQIDPKVFLGLVSDDDQTCTIETTVPTGMEDVITEEAAEKLGVKAVSSTGRVFFDIKIEDVPKVLTLRAVENVNVVIHMEHNFPFTKEREECFKSMYQLVKKPLWRKGLRVWQTVFKDNVYDDPFINDRPLTAEFQEPNPLIDLRSLKDGSPVALNLPEDIKLLRKQMAESKKRKSAEKDAENTQSSENQDSNKDLSSEDKTTNNTTTDKTDSKAEESDDVEPSSKTVKDANGDKSECSPEMNGLSFRVNCYRSGTTHVFGSQEGARQFGGAINDRFKWRVDLSKFLVEVILDISDDFVRVSIGLTREPLFKRNLVAFGPTNLRATLCYSLVHLAKPKCGDFVVDHMCGGASIPIEGALSFPSCYYFGGDINYKAVQRARTNIDHISQRQSLPCDVLLWDSTRLPLRDASVDVLVSDLPFGKRSGSKLDNRVLYLRALQETARVTRPDTGRAVLLTHDRNSMIKNLMKVRQYWTTIWIRTTNIESEDELVSVFSLQRSNLEFTGRDLPQTRKKCQISKLNK